MLQLPEGILKPSYKIHPILRVGGQGRDLVGKAKVELAKVTESVEARSSPAFAGNFAVED